MKRVSGGGWLRSSSEARSRVQRGDLPTQPPERASDATEAGRPDLLEKWRREQLSRRSFLRGAAGGAAVLLAGSAAASCGGDSSESGPPDVSVPPVDANPLTPDASPTPSCVETEDNILGPYYKAGAPDRDTLYEPGDPGVRLTLTGTVFVRDQASYTPACTPLAAALLDVWQANDAAVYDSAGFNYRGKIYTANDGSYTLHTIIPGHYLNGAQYRPAHIHFRVSGTTTPTELLTTQLYFEGDPYNDIDPFILPSLIMPIIDDGAGGKLAMFDFVIRSAP
jgi:protocatechuate 3,4-dioxygenase beta subunit